MVWKIAHYYWWICNFFFITSAEQLFNLICSWNVRKTFNGNVAFLVFFDDYGEIFVLTYHRIITRWGLEREKERLDYSFDIHYVVWYTTSPFFKSLFATSPRSVSYNIPNSNEKKNFFFFKKLYVWPIVKTQLVQIYFMSNFQSLCAKIL